MPNRAIKTADLAGQDLNQVIHSIEHPDATTPAIDYASPHSSAWLGIADQAGILCGPSPFPGAAYAAGIGSSWEDATHIQTGDTRAEAALRCVVASRLGLEVTLAPHAHEAGDKVFVISEQKLATVLNVYGNGANGSYGDIRLDLCGNTPIEDIQPYDPMKHSKFDHTFLPITAEWKKSYGITKDIPLRQAMLGLAPMLETSPQLLNVSDPDHELHDKPENATANDYVAIGKIHGIFFERDLGLRVGGPTNANLYDLIDNENVVKTGIIGDHNALVELGRHLVEKGLVSRKTADNIGINVLIKVTEHPDWGTRHVAEIASGYRTGKLLSMGDTDIPQHFTSHESAVQWLEEIGYTVIEPSSTRNIPSPQPGNDQAMPLGTGTASSLSKQVKAPSPAVGPSP